MTRKNNFFEGCSWLKFNHLRLAQGLVFKIYTRVAKGSKTKSLPPTFLEVTGEKLVGGLFDPPPTPPLHPSWIGLKKSTCCYYILCNLWIETKHNTDKVAYGRMTSIPPKRTPKSEVCKLNSLIRHWCIYKRSDGDLVNIVEVLLKKYENDSEISGP